MSIGQVLLSNTFNEFRVTVNDIANTVNDLTSNILSGDIVANTITVGQVSSNLIPDANSIHDLGSTTNRWKDLYLSGNTIFLGDAEISFDGANLLFEVAGLNVFDSSSVFDSANINAANITFGTLDVNRLDDSGVVLGNYGSANQIASFTVDAKGRITSAANINLDIDAFSNASNLTTGTLPDARFPATLPTANGVNLTFLNASNIDTGTLPDARFPATLPTANGVNLTFLNASNLGTGTVPDARFPATLPTANGVNLTFLNASNLGTGTLALARGGTGETSAQLAINSLAAATTSGQYLRGNGSNVVMSSIQAGDVPTLNQNTTGSAATLTTPRAINGTNFDGSAAITITAAATNTATQLLALGVGTAASGTTGEIRATNNVTAFFSDRRLKTSITPISDALNKICGITGVTFQSNDTAAKYGYTDQKIQVGVIAQEVEKVLPQVVFPAPFDIGQNEDGTEYSLSGENYMTVQYEKLIPLLIEAIKELKAEVDQLKNIKG